MAIARHQEPVTITTTPRSTLEHTCHRGIDAILKDLRVCSRCLKSTLDAFKDELRTLERLYYKCKNQHHIALFFKRVPEIRRYGRRLSELDILERVDLLRASFVGLENTNDHKTLRGSWSHVPDGPYVYFLTERLTACFTLVCKMRERLERAYCHFALAMQTGAFAQLIILFVGISCRMSVLSSQLEETLQLSIATCDRLSVMIHPTGRYALISQQVASEPVASHPSHVDCDLLPEDTGHPVSHCEPVGTSALAAKIQTETTSKMPLPSHPTDAADHTKTQISKDVSAKTVHKSRVKKARKKVDEIDEIFGF